ncbi:hypothetical protein SD77_4373 [Bacillus badius]|uniref:Ribose 5-phosphate isomerase B n=1 Tax=Bacillus badius TaxID=1455 RepID=A0ABR5AWU5_BACBA|nr:hypothetical protein SD78_0678 [Bacillus badius]KIL78693.1 hypothetical protein SD77_4373 [Bacillus badius]
MPKENFRTGAFRFSKFKPPYVTKAVSLCVFIQSLRLSR